MDEGWILVLGLFLLVVVYVDSAACGNAELEEGEICDRDRLGGANCTNSNYTGGFLSCLDDCSGYDFSTCEGEEVCGNGVIMGSELCEPGNVRGRTCEDEGYEGGTLGCKSSCVKYDYSQCTGNKSICGDGLVTGKEECDGANLNNENCGSLGYISGVLSCNSNCSFNFGLCFKDINEDLNETEEANDINETVGESNESIVNEEIPSGVKGAAGDVNKFDFGLSLKSWLIIIIGILVAGVILIYVYVFKIKK